MVDNYEIRQGVPVPSSDKQSGLTRTMRAMSCGDSIVIPGAKLSSAHPCAAQVGIKIKTRKNSDGTATVWCVSSPVSSDSPRKPGRPRKPGALPVTQPCVDAVAHLKSAVTAANPALGLPEGYYAQENPYGPRVWVEGKPPTAEESKVIQAFNMSIFD